MAALKDDIPQDAPFVSFKTLEDQFDSTGIVRLEATDIEWASVVILRPTTAIIGDDAHVMVLDAGERTDDELATALNRGEFGDAAIAGDEALWAALNEKTSAAPSNRPIVYRFVGPNLTGGGRSTTVVSVEWSRGISRRWTSPARSQTRRESHDPSVDEFSWETTAAPHVFLTWF